MIPKSGRKFQPWMESICRHVSSEPTRSITDSPHDDTIYIGAGYWRAILVRDDDENIVGARLVNPDRTADEIQTVERAICILDMIRD